MSGSRATFLCTNLSKNILERYNYIKSQLHGPVRGIQLDSQSKSVDLTVVVPRKITTSYTFNSDRFSIQNPKSTWDKLYLSVQSNASDPLKITLPELKLTTPIVGSVVFDPPIVIYDIYIQGLNKVDFEILQITDCVDSSDFHGDTVDFHFLSKISCPFSMTFSTDINMKFASQKHLYWITILGLCIGMTVAGILCILFSESVYGIFLGVSIGIVVLILSIGISSVITVQKNNFTNVLTISGVYQFDGVIKTSVTDKKDNLSLVSVLMLSKTSPVQKLTVSNSLHTKRGVFSAIPGLSGLILKQVQGLIDSYLQSNPFVKTLFNTDTVLVKDISGQIKSAVTRKFTEINTVLMNTILLQNNPVTGKYQIDTNTPFTIDLQKIAQSAESVQGANGSTIFILNKKSTFSDTTLSIDIDGDNPLSINNPAEGCYNKNCVLAEKGKPVCSNVWYDIRSQSIDTVRIVITPLDMNKKTLYNITDVSFDFSELDISGASFVSRSNQISATLTTDTITLSGNIHASIMIRSGYCGTNYCGNPVKKCGWDPDCTGDLDAPCAHDQHDILGLDFSYAFTATTKISGQKIHVVYDVDYDILNDKILIKNISVDLFNISFDNVTTTDGDIHSRFTGFDYTLLPVLAPLGLGVLAGVGGSVGLSDLVGRNTNLSWIKGIKKTLDGMIPDQIKKQLNDNISKTLQNVTASHPDRYFQIDLDTMKIQSRHIP